MSLLNPMRALTVVIEWGLDALATILDPGPGVPAEYLWNVGADELAEDEAEEEVAEPTTREEAFDPYHIPHPSCSCPCVNCSNQAHWMCHGEGVEIDADFDEPPLTGSELVAIRQLLEEHSNFITTPCADGAAGDPGPAAQDGPAPGNSTGRVTPGAGHLSRDDLMDAARAVRWYAKSSQVIFAGPSWHALGARLEDAAITAPK